MTIRTLETFRLAVIGVWGSGTGGCSVVTNVRDGCTCVRQKFSLEAEGSQSSYRSERPHVKDAKNPVEVQSPGSDRFFIVLRVVTSRDHIPFTPLDDVPLDIIRSPDLEHGEKLPGYASLIQLTSLISQSLQGQTD